MWNVGDDAWLDAPLGVLVALALRGLVDVLVGTPLVFAPEAVLRGLGWRSTDAVTATLLGALLVAAGALSIFAARDRANVAAARSGASARLALDAGATLAYVAVLSRGDQLAEATGHAPVVLPLLLAVNGASLVAMCVYAFRFNFVLQRRSAADDGGGGLFGGG